MIAKRTEDEIAQKEIASYDKTDKNSIHALDIEKFELVPAEHPPTGRKEWSAKAEIETGGDIHLNRYFYRAMTTAEYYHLRKHGHMSQTNGHQGLAPNRSYSRKYLKDSYTHLVEFEFPPNFRLTMYIQGWKEGSLEAGCLAWGIGSAHKNSWSPNADPRNQYPTQPKTKKAALHPYEIYKMMVPRIPWKLVNLLDVPI